MCDTERQRVSAWKERIRRHVPILKWIYSYKKEDLVADAIAGLTVGLTLIPQSVAYAALAGLSAEYGLYSSFMGGFIYVIFGTVKEVSVGPTSLISLLTFEFTKDLSSDFIFLLTFMSGCFEFLLGILQFGFLVNFISAPVTTSFQSATSLIIISSQLKDLLGLPKFQSGRFLDNILTVAGKIHEANVGDIILSAFCCTLLLSLRKLNDLNIVKNKAPTGREKYLKKTLWYICISRNAICVLISSVIAYVFTTNGQAPFKLSGNIPAGLPLFRPPQFSTRIGNETLSFTEMMYQISPGVFILPLIAILANVTIAKAFSVGIPVDATQEMLTLGLCNMSGAFVSSLPTCGAFTRSAVSNSSGVRTPLAGLFTGTLIILVIKFLTPYFSYIPKATLASVLICAVILMIDWRTIFLLWKVNKLDFCCSSVTFFACLILGIQIGLLTGVAINIGHLLYLWARPSISIQLKTTSEGSYYLVTPDIGLFFPAVDFLRNELTAKCTQSIPVVINCQYFKGLDYTAAQSIKGIEGDCRQKNQKLTFIQMDFNVYRVLKNSNMDVSLGQCPSGEELNDILFHSNEMEKIVVVLSGETNSKCAKSLLNSSEENRQLKT